MEEVELSVFFFSRALGHKHKNAATDIRAWEPNAFFPNIVCKVLLLFFFNYISVPAADCNLWGGKMELLLLLPGRYLAIRRIGVIVHVTCLMWKQTINHESLQWYLIMFRNCCNPRQNFRLVLALSVVCSVNICKLETSLTFSPFYSLYCAHIEMHLCVEHHDRMILSDIL